ncbi:MAG TPA: tyrosine-type recombinase/integrase [Jatrophihabitantaceae bacterium]|jgi:integrase
MGHSYRRIGDGGKPRYTAVYHDARGKRRSAGTYATKKAADRKWQDAESKVAEGRLGDPRRGRVGFKTYVEETWLPNHQLELTTRQRYTYSIDKHLMPEFADFRMIDILPEHVRVWIARLKDEGVSASTIADCKTILSAIFTTALNDQVIYLHPCRGVKSPPVPRKPRTIVTPEQFDVIYRALPETEAPLLVEVAIETGLRWGELSELRPSDLDVPTRMLTVSRAVVEVSPRFQPKGARFTIKLYPKNREYRRLKLSRQIVEKLTAHILLNTIQRDELLFDMVRIQPEPARPLRIVLDPEALGRTEPNAAGRTYRHGTLTGYSLGRCKCEQCRYAYTEYRAARRAIGKDSPRAGRLIDTDGHVPRSWFRQHIWRPALAEADLTFNVRIHDLRHAHASWLLAGGADIQVVKERMGHGSLRTTERYLHTLPDADETALDALSKIRSRSRRA